ncbi:MAG TPA: hypothetical protein VGI10_04325 [Polyangiaceae bacterium]|jgi:hypothetical protein
MSKHDPVGWFIVATPPLAALASAIGRQPAVNPFYLVPFLFCIAVVVDAPRWGLPRWLWCPLALIWPVSLPTYIAVRSFNRAPLHPAAGIAAIVLCFAVFWAESRLL